MWIEYLDLLAFCHCPKVLATHTLFVLWRSLFLYLVLKAIPPSSHFSGIRESGTWAVKRRDTKVNKPSSGSSCCFCCCCTFSSSPSCKWSRQQQQQKSKVSNYYLASSLFPWKYPWMTDLQYTQKQTRKKNDERKGRNRERKKKGRKKERQSKK